MLDTLKTPLKLPSYKTLSQHEGKGNYAVRRYYIFPFSFFYRYKLRMVAKLLGNKVHHNILDYGSGPGIFTEELKKHSLFVHEKEFGQRVHPKWRFDVAVCASVLEFVNLDQVLHEIYILLKPAGKIVVASPLKNKLTSLYFWLVRSKFKRHSHDEILSKVSRYFIIEKYESWLGLYFALRGRKRIYIE